MNPCVAYVGDDPGLIKDLTNFVKNNSHQEQVWALREIRPTQEFCAELIDLKDTVLVIIDFSFFENPLTEQMCQSLAMMKQSMAWKTVPFVGLFSSKEEIESLSYVFPLGVSFSHIKGVDTALFLKDCAWLAVGVQEHFHSFATAKNLNLPYHIESLAPAVRMGGDYIMFDMDVLPQEGERLIFPPFGDQSPREVTVESYYQHGRWHDSFYHAHIQLGFGSPWEAPDAETLQKDTLETWLANHAEASVTPQRALLFSYNKELAKTVLRNPHMAGLRLTCTDDEKQLKEYLLALAPIVICLDSPNDTFEDVFVNILNQAFMENPDWSPYVLICGGRRETDNWREILETEKILTYPKRLDEMLLATLMEVTAKKIGEQTQADGYSFALNDPQRVAQCPLSVKITSISEHDVSFLCSAEIPMFSVLHLVAPLSMYLLVIPHYKHLPRDPHGIHYQAIIHGLDSNEEMQLRLYVNSLIFEPPQVFGVMPTHPVPLPKEENSIKSADKKTVEQPAVTTKVAPLVRRVTAGKSKL